MRLAALRSTRLRTCRIQLQFHLVATRSTRWLLLVLLLLLLVLLVLLLLLLLLFLVAMA
eukprot:COSAG06_NODE_12931_length_1311_cov_1.023102_1_plen_58_part_10